MAGTFLCIGLSFVVVAVIILSTIGYHKIYVETVWATEIEEDLPEEEKKKEAKKQAEKSELDKVNLECFNLAKEKSKTHNDAVTELCKKYVANGNPKRITNIDDSKALLEELKALK